MADDTEQTPQPLSADRNVAERADSPAPDAELATPVERPGTASGERPADESPSAVAPGESTAVANAATVAPVAVGTAPAAATATDAAAAADAESGSIPRDPRAKTARRIGSRRKAPRRVAGPGRVASGEPERTGSNQVETGRATAGPAAAGANENRKGRASNDGRKSRTDCKSRSTTRANRKNKLRHLNRRDLLELLEDLSRENDRLRAQLAEANRKLEDRAALMEQCGSMAEASMALADVFKAADRAAHIYVDSCKRESAKLRQLNAEAAQEAESAKHGAHAAHAAGARTADAIAPGEPEDTDAASAPGTSQTRDGETDSESETER